MTESVVVRGHQVWPYLEKWGELEPASYVYQGKVGWAEPLKQYGEILFLSRFPSVGAIYWHKDAIWYTRALSTFMRNEVILGSMLRAGAKVKWVLPVYKAMIAFGLQVIPYGKWAGRLISMASIATFWHKHNDEIEKAIGVATKLFKDMRWFHNRCEKLSTFMLLMAMEQTGDKLTADMRKHGIVNVITSHLDFEKYMEDIATFVGSLLKMIFCGAGTAPIGWLGLRGIKVISSMADIMWKCYSVSNLVGKGMTVAAGPGVKDPHLLLTGFLKLASNPAGTIIEARIRETDTEGHLQNPTVRQRLEEIKNGSDRLDSLLTKLTEAAEWEIF